MCAARRNACVAVLLLTQAACATAKWAGPIGEFKRNVDESVTVVASYYGNLNEFERHLYLENAAADPAVRLGQRDEKGNSTALAGMVFAD